MLESSQTRLWHCHWVPKKNRRRSLVAPDPHCSVLRCFINPRVRKIRGLQLPFLFCDHVASSPDSPLPHLLDRHRKLVASCAIPARSCPGPVRYHWGSIVELDVPPDETSGLRTLHPHNTKFLSFNGVCVALFLKCVLLCFIKPILGNRYGPGVIP